MAGLADELRELPDDELTARIDSAKEELFNLRFQLATGQLDNPARIREVRHDVARIHTVLREREIELELDALAAQMDEAGDDDEEGSHSERSGTHRSGRRPSVGAARCARAWSSRTAWTRPSWSASTARSSIRSTRRPCGDRPSSPRTTRRTTRTWATPSGVMETRPLSKSKRWRVVEVIERAK